jgi:hypothetical protein
MLAGIDAAWWQGGRVKFWEIQGQQEPGHLLWEVVLDLVLKSQVHHTLLADRAAEALGKMWTSAVVVVSLVIIQEKGKDRA